MQDQGRSYLLLKMDEAFGMYSMEAERLSVLLAEPRDPASRTSYHDLLQQRTAEVVAYEKYSKIKEELFALIVPPALQNRPESTIN
jgi:hypothetical protein